jgi:hypothetical protein
LYLGFSEIQRIPWNDKNNIYQPKAPAIPLFRACREIYYNLFASLTGPEQLGTSTISPTGKIKPGSWKSIAYPGLCQLLLGNKTDYKSSCSKERDYKSVLFPV